MVQKRKDFNVKGNSTKKLDAPSLGLTIHDKRRQNEMLPTMNETPPSRTDLSGKYSTQRRVDSRMHTSVHRVVPIVVC